MKIFKTVLSFLFAAFIIYGGVNHFLKPAMYAPFIPSFLPNDLVNYGTGVVEIILGVGVFIPKYRYQAGLGLFVLMLIFLPLHVWDVFKEKPAIGSHQAALVRLPIQFLFLGITWWMGKE